MTPILHHASLYALHVSQVTDLALTWSQQGLVSEAEVGVLPVAVYRGQKLVELSDAVHFGGGTTKAQRILHLDVLGGHRTIVVKVIVVLYILVK